MNPNELKLVKQIVFAALSVLLLAIGGCYGVEPQYRVWEQHMEGKAQLAKAEYAKQILVQDAMARDESAKHLAQAEITRAEGVAKANKIIGESLKNNESYLRYLWIHNLEEGNHDVIYVPTEANLPVLEAGGRFHAPAPPAKVSE